MGNQTDVDEFEDYSDHLVITVAFVVILTLVVNSTTMKPLINKLKMNTVSKEKRYMYNLAMEQLDQMSLKCLQVRFCT